MIASDPPVLSNWDFSGVHDLLRSPTYKGTSEPFRHHEDSTPSFPDEETKHPTCHTREIMSPSSQRSFPRLGDFSAVWELLHGESAPTSVASPSVTTKSELDMAQPPLDEVPSALIEKSSKGASFSGLTNHVPTSPSITILKRVPGHKPLAENTKNASVNMPLDIPRTPAKPIAGAGDLSDTPKAKSKRRSRGKTSRNDPFSSEGSAGVDSDTSLVFDPPMCATTDAFAFIPAQVGTPEAKHNRYDTPPSSYDDSDCTLTADTIKGLAGGTHVRSTLYKSSIERRVALVRRLLDDFPEYATIVSRSKETLTGSSEGIDSPPIHVFIDMSNILVGFHDAVKASRSIPLSTRIRRIHMSFSNLALIMERGRQTAKRVLVGSDRLPSIDEAESLGYETNILERVQKKSGTPRLEKVWKDGLPSKGTIGGPETVAAPGRVEQGVDEILHLKMLESLIDTDKPATIVLATGDAAAAEFSGGFMKMVERALRRRWKVELVSFAQGTSYAYRRKEFRNQWGDQFQLIELDPYVEELFDR
ncbi:uncharacterized protein N7515_003385 [Penicillium bovifimosum]|uniref:NYN domain-containing protein n=1 Tax=Penicillium bovifimosum TaxID=126998 RepID=A0A9W9L667_9EURO|nr:uncharacterized protein N7515_003385 [Penicillium bovifimosum]KAJ5138537.1 hypothetical protein N7515_003385 [Penicillium bovifimosum]